MPHDLRLTGLRYYAHIYNAGLFAMRTVVAVLGIFFFSSRRRHTRLQGDWSSDVCSSDLIELGSLEAWDRQGGQSARVRGQRRAFGLDAVDLQKVREDARVGGVAEISRRRDRKSVV